MTRRPPRLRPRVAAAAALALALSACSGAEPAPPTPEPVPIGADAPLRVDPELLEFHEQEVEWEECRSGRECAEIEVPLDYARPKGRTLTLAVLRVPATDADSRIGSLVVNPGGPGASGLDYAAAASQYFGKPVRAAFDIVGFDPRGVGSSTPIDCVADEQLDELVAADPDPDTAAEKQLGRRLFNDLAAGCVARSGELAGHVSTTEAARDIDILRGVLGEERLAYFGASYGTLLGASYAELFPRRVGRMVLDGAIDPTLPVVERSLAQAHGFQLALTSYLENCVAEGDCFLGEDVAAAERVVAELLESMDQEPLPADDRPLTQGWAFYGILLPLYNRDLWPLLDAGLKAALDGDGRSLMRLAEAYLGREPEGYRNNFVEAYFTIKCLDDSDVVDPDDLERYRRAFGDASPAFGGILAAGINSCADWPVEAVEPLPSLSAAGAAPILVVGTTRDPATPLEWAEALAAQLESGVLVRRDGDGHIGYGKGNACVDTAVEDYLLRGVVPSATVDC